MSKTYDASLQGCSMHRDCKIYVTDITFLIVEGNEGKINRFFVSE